MTPPSGNEVDVSLIWEAAPCPPAPRWPPLGAAGCWAAVAAIIGKTNSNVRTVHRNNGIGLSLQLTIRCTRFGEDFNSETV
jgi:hypothetical protein